MLEVNIDQHDNISSRSVALILAGNYFLRDAGTARGRVLAKSDQKSVTRGGLVKQLEMLSQRNPTKGASERLIGHLGIQKLSIVHVQGRATTLIVNDRIHSP